MERNEKSGRMETRRTPLPLYEEVENADFGMAVKATRTMHGFIDKVQSFYEHHLVPTEVHDLRLPFPAPRLNLCTGLRGSQFELLSKALNQNRSGLIGAPTRYGKTRLILNTIRAFPGIVTVLAAPGIDLVEQLYEDVRLAFPQDDVRILHGKTRKKTQGDITVVSMDSLDKCDAASTRLVLVDEPHALVTDGRMPDFLRFEKARKYGFGATLDGRFDGRDPLIEGLIGPVLASISYLEAVAEGAIAPITVLMIVIPYKRFYAHDRAAAYKAVLWQSDRAARIIDWLISPNSGVFPPDWQLLGFIGYEKQLNFLKEHVSSTPWTAAMDKLLTAAERQAVTQGVKDGSIRVCMATGIYAQGVTFSDLRVVMNLVGGGASTQTIQKPGRVAETRPGKRCGVLVDFLFEPTQDSIVTDAECWCPVHESRVRKKYYEERGFTVHRCPSFQSLQRAVKEHCI